MGRRGRKEGRGKKTDRLLTTEIQVNRSRDLAHLVLGLNLVQARVGLDNIVELEDDEELVRPDALHPEVGP